MFHHEQPARHVYCYQVLGEADIIRYPDTIGRTWWSKSNNHQPSSDNNSNIYQVSSQAPCQRRQERRRGGGTGGTTPVLSRPSAGKVRWKVKSDIHLELSSRLAGFYLYNFVQSFCFNQRKGKVRLM